MTAPADDPTAPHPDDPYKVRYFQRHPDDDPERTVPGFLFLRSCPDPVRSKFFAVLIHVAKAPPTRVAGGGYWEAMHGAMTGYYEVRVDGPRRRHYRLFCLLESPPPGWRDPALVIITGLDKPFRTVFADDDYAAVRALGKEYGSRVPRCLT